MVIVAVDPRAIGRERVKTYVVPSQVRLCVLPLRGTRMYPPVQVEEMAFAMTLFVSAANGQISIGRRPLTVQNQHEGQTLFLRLSSNSAPPIDAEELAAALRTRLYEAFLIIWEHYRSEEQQASIGARVLGFYYLMARSRGEALTRWLMPSSQSDETVGLHPAVVQTVATFELQQDGRLDETRFLQTVESTARTYPENIATNLQTPAVWPVLGGEMAALVRAFDWSKSALGPIGRWPQSMKTVVDLALACRFPMVVLWGKELVQIYNDSYCELMGDKHPAGLGQSTRDCWPEVWNINEPIYKMVLQGETVTFEDGLYPIKRHGHLEEAYFTLCYSPLRDEGSLIKGILVTVFETTDRVKAELAREL